MSESRFAVRGWPEGSKMSVALEAAGYDTLEHERTVKLLENFAEYEDLVAKATAAHAWGDFERAAVFSSMAAQAAAHRHAGIFFSKRLESILNDIAGKLEDKTSLRRGPASSGRIKRVLHVASHLVEIGGHTKLLASWIGADKNRAHSLALTRHRGPVPAFVEAEVRDAGGTIYRVNSTPGRFLAWARQLRRIAADFDLVVLHAHNEDVVPLLAFGGSVARPPVALLNHSDHMFWLGTSISDIVVNLRAAAESISIERRAVAKSRSTLVPTLVGAIERSKSRRDAKLALGLDPERIILFSAAREPKYRTVHGVTFADTHVALLKRFPQATLIVLGAGEPKDWKPAQDAVPGQIVPMKGRSDPRTFFEAADIYVDSFPFVSSTSMMEAAGYGLPLVSRFYESSAMDIIGINHPGLIDASIIAASDEDYVATLSRLVSDPEYRGRSGAAAREAVEKLHRPPGWLDLLEAALARLESVPLLDANEFLANAPVERPHLGEPDSRLNELFGIEYGELDLARGYLGVMPLRDRLRYWNGLRKAGMFEDAKESIRLLLPEWVVRRLKDR